MQLTKQARWILLSGAFFALLSVIIGAFAAHGLKSIVDESSLRLIETACRYQMYHALALLFCGFLVTIFPSAQAVFKSAAIAFISGILLFSGSLDALALSQIKWLGMITPIGGLAFIWGWLAIIYGLIRSPYLTQQ